MPIRLPPACAELLDQQCGILARWQAPLCSLNPAVIDSLLRRGRWQPLYRGVYAAFTGLPPRESLLWAAICRCGPSAILSYQSAAESDHLIDVPDSVIHVTVAPDNEFAVSCREHRGTTPCIVVHQLARIGAVRHPARTPPRTRIEETTLDLTQTADDLDSAVAWLSRACGRRLTTATRLESSMAARPRVRWRAELARALHDVGAGAHSTLEYRYIRLVERPHRLPVAVRQAKVVTGSLTRYVDNLYAGFGVAVELDGQVAHPAETTWQDLRRDNSLAHAGLVTLHYTWADVTRRPCQTAREIAAVLTAHGWPGTASRCGSCGRLP